MVAIVGAYAYGRLDLEAWHKALRMAWPDSSRAPQRRLARASEAWRYPIAAVIGVVDLDTVGDGTCSETQCGN